MDYYALLGVSRNAKEDDIKKAFRKLALEYHPDKHQSAAPDVKIKAAQKFQAVTEAYETLGNGARRLSYDRAGRRQYGQHKSSARQYNPRAYNYHGYTTETRPRGTMFGFFSAFARGMTRTDAIFHAAMAGVFVFGAMFASFAGDALWDRWNSGRLFQHIQAPDKPWRKMGAKAAEADS